MPGSRLVVAVPVAVAIIVLSCTSAQDSGPTRSDPLRKVAPDLGFTVRVPSAEWQCTTGNTHGYQCLPSGGDPFFSAFSVMVSDPNSEPFDRDGFIRGAVARARAKGWKTYAPAVEDSEIPFAGATHFVFLADASDNGPTCLLAAYIGRDERGRDLTFIHVVRGTSEPASFREFVKSYRKAS